MAADEQPALAGTKVPAPAAVPAKVLAIAVPVIVAGAAALAYAVYRYVGIVAFGDGSGRARRPLREHGASPSGSPCRWRESAPAASPLGFVFAVSAIILLGWPAGVIVAAGAPMLTHLLQRRPPLRVAYNGAMFALSALVAGLAVERIHGDSVAALVAQVVVCGFLYYWVVNLILISAILAASSGRSFFTIAKENITQTTAPFAFMASAALTLIVLWQRQPILSIALVGPLLAIALYQRSTHKAMQAMRLALTDPLTGLGNHRSFHERLQRELVVAEHEGSSLALCLVDFDDLKSVNDRFGHPVGDLVLGQVASRLRQGGESFRLGGDEFAVLLPRQDERQATAVARSIVERVAALDVEGVGPVTVSAGVATYPMQGSGRDELIRLADSALYWAKKDGKNRVRAYAAESILRGQPRADRGHAGPRGAVPGGREPGEGGRRARRVHGKPLAARRRVLGANRAPPRRRRRSGRADPARRQPPRPRQARDPGGGPPQAGRAERGGAAHPRAASADRLPDAREPRRPARRRVGPPSPRALGRRRLPEPARRRPDPARGADHLRRRRLRRDDVRPRLLAGDATAGGARRARALRRHAVRPRGRASARRGAAAGGRRSRAPRRALRSAGSARRAGSPAAARS